jgi:hypothetical protein
VKYFALLRDAPWVWLRTTRFFGEATTLLLRNVCCSEGQAAYAAEMILTTSKTTILGQALLGLASMSTVHSTKNVTLRHSAWKNKVNSQETATTTGCLRAQQLNRGKGSQSRAVQQLASPQQMLHTTTSDFPSSSCLSLLCAEPLTGGIFRGSLSQCLRRASRQSQSQISNARRGRHGSPCSP